MFVKIALEIISILYQTKSFERNILFPMHVKVMVIWTRDVFHNICDCRGWWVGRVLVWHAGDRYSSSGLRKIKLLNR